MVRSRRHVLVAALLALVVAACGGDAGDTTTTASAEATTTTEGTATTEGTTTTEAPAEETTTSAGDESITIGVPAIIATHPFYADQYRFFDREATRQGVELVIVDSAPTGEVNEVQMLDDAYALLESGVDAIIMEYINAEPWLDFAVEAAERGVCVLNESQTPLTGAQNWGEDNYAGGFAVGVSAGEWANARGDTEPKMAVIVRPDNPPLLARSDGFVAGVQSVVPGATVVAEAQALGPEEHAAAFANMAAAHPEATIWFSPEIDSGVAGLAALEEQGMTDPAEVFLAVTNVSESGLEILAAGDTPLQAAYMYSKNNLASIQMFRDAVNCAKGESLPPTVTMKGTVVTSENLADVQTMLEDLDSDQPYPDYLEEMITDVIEYSDEALTTP